jgi:hypothetical protein
MDASNDWVYLIRAVDAAIYFWLSQINVTLLRLWQGRHLLHRMTGRTVVHPAIVSKCHADVAVYDLHHSGEPTFIRSLTIQLGVLVMQYLVYKTSY